MHPPNLMQICFVDVCTLNVEDENSKVGVLCPRVGMGGNLQEGHQWQHEERERLWQRVDRWMGLRRRAVILMSSGSLIQNLLSLLKASLILEATEGAGRAERIKAWKTPS